VGVSAARCRFCLEDVPPAEIGFGAIPFCRDAVECNYRARLRLGVPRYQANILRGRERRTYPRAQGGER
jgi:hypothetical protein